MLFKEKKECCGCGACKNACPKNAISMVEDEEGFKYPIINQSLCVKCGICEKVCQIQTFLSDFNEEPSVYAVQNKDAVQREASTSGGVYPVLAKWALDQGGIVYGVAYNDEFEAKHFRATTWKEAELFVGSKYVQSDTGDIFRQIRKDVLEEKIVLFTGTPCQVAGLKLYMGDKQYDNLITCEIMCHAAPSPLMWKEHLRFIEKTRRSKVVSYKHRPKVAGWHGHNEMFTLENGQCEYKTKLSQNHKDLFYAHLIIRPSCYSCKYAGTKRKADFMIADFWGIELTLPDFDDNKGTSLVILNSKKAKMLFESIKSEFNVRNSTIDAAFKENHKTPARMNINRENFWNDYYNHGYEYVLKKYSGYTLAKRIKRQMKFGLKKFVKAIGVYGAVHEITKKKYQGKVFK